MNTKEIKKFLKKNQKPLLIALGVLVAVVVFWIIVKRNRTNGSYHDDFDDDVTPGTNFKELARRMFAAWITTWGTDENEVYSILAMMNNQADWEYLQKAYHRYWNEMPVYEQVFHTFAGLGLSGVLVSDFRRELNKKELQRCRDILEENNIIPGF